MTIRLEDLKRLVPAPTNKTDADYQPFRDAANVVVTLRLFPIIVDSALLYQIELYLAAHFCTIGWEYGGLRVSAEGNARDEYRGLSSQVSGFMTTRYGEQACALDPTGTLTEMSKPTNKAQFKVVPSNMLNPPW